jgi:flagellar hook-associated protein 3 FlgL
MSTPRITQRLMVQRSLSSLQLGLGRLATTQEKLSTGRTINRPSDSPTGTNQAMRLRQQLAADAQHSRNAQDGLSWMGAADSTLTSMLDSTRRARDLILQASSTGSNGPDARNAIAQELTQIREALLAQANTQHMGRPLFGGTTGNAVAYEEATDASGVTTVSYVGDGNDVNRTIGDGVNVKVNTNGPAAFGADGSNLFDVLDTAIDKVKNDPSSLGTTLGDLDDVLETMRTALADVGTRYGRVESAMTRLDGTTLDNQKALSDVENVDIAKAIVDLQMQEVAYQSALGATARVLQPSLLDFLR